MTFKNQSTEHEFLEKIQEYLDTKFKLQILDHPGWFDSQE